MSEQSYVPLTLGEGYFSDFQPPVDADHLKPWVWDRVQGKFVPYGLNYEPAGAVAAHAALTSGVHGISAFGATLIDDAAASNARTTLGLGTAATLDTGTSAGNIVQLDGSAKLPAVDGSQLTNLPGGGGGSPGGSTTQVQYNNAGSFAGDAGLTYDAANDALTVAGRVVTGVIRPASDSTTAVQVQTAAGTAVMTVDTTNDRVGIGAAPVEKLTLYNGAGNAFVLLSTAINGDSGFKMMEDFVSAGQTLGFSLFYAGATNDFRINSYDNSATPVTRLTINRTSGNVDINTGALSVAAGVTVVGSASFGSFSGGVNTDLNLVSSSAFDTAIKFREQSAATGFNIRYGGADNTFYVAGFNSSAEVNAIAIARNTGYVGINGVTVPTAALDLAASTTTRASARIRSGVAPTTKNDGDIWYDGTHLYMRIAGADKQLDN